MSKPTQKTVKYWLDWFSSFAEDRLSPPQCAEALEVLNLADCALSDAAENAALHTRLKEAEKFARWLRTDYQDGDGTIIYRIPAHVGRDAAAWLTKEGE